MRTQVFKDAFPDSFIYLFPREGRKRLTNHHEAAIAGHTPCSFSTSQLSARGGAGLESNALPGR